MRRRQAGKMYEMYVLVLILGLVFAVGLPAYVDYKKRQLVSESLSTASEAMNAIEKTFAARGPTDMSAPGAVAWTTPPPSETVSSISIRRDGVITIVYTGRLGKEGDQLQLVPVVQGAPLDLSLPANKGRPFEWQCAGAAGKTTLKSAYRPGSCR